MARAKSLLIALTLFVASIIPVQASASSYEIFSSSVWQNTNSTTLTGDISVTVAGIPFYCKASLTFTVSSGVASITAASFTGSSACLGITVQNIPWPVGQPTAGVGSGVIVFITGINLKFSSPAATCTGSLNGVLTNANPNTGPATNKLTFTGTLSAPCTNFKGTLYSSKPIRAVIW